MSGGKAEAINPLMWKKTCRAKNGKESINPNEREIPLMETQQTYKDRLYSTCKPGCRATGAAGRAEEG